MNCKTCGIVEPGEFYEYGNRKRLEFVENPLIEYQLIIDIDKIINGGGDAYTKVAEIKILLTKHFIG